MQSNCKNIYRTARIVAGCTQEKAAEMLGISVRSLADYENGVRLPPNDVVNDMVMCYGYQPLGVQHIRNTSEFAQSLLPDVVNIVSLPEAVLTLIDAIYDFADDKMDRELIDIARDGTIDEAERVRFDRIVEKINTIVSAALAVRCARAEVGY